MIRIREAIIVEGRYDKNTLAQIVDAPILETSGFGIFHDRQRLALLRRLAETRGIIVLTDSDGAGFVIRNYLRGAIDPSQVKHAYIPDVAGKERRKRTASKEGKLGVEGMRPDVLLEALCRAGATIRRRRECLACQKRFTTYEIIETLPLVVIKRDGSRQSFDKSKLINGMVRACDKRKVPLPVLEKIADEIEQELQSALEREITTEQVGEMVMKRLKNIDEVAYVRFASVYRQFKDIDTFMQELTKLLNDRG